MIKVGLQYFSLLSRYLFSPTTCRIRRRITFRWLVHFVASEGSCIYAFCSCRHGENEAYWWRVTYVPTKVETWASPGEAYSVYTLGFLVKIPCACKERYHTRNERSVFWLSLVKCVSKRCPPCFFFFFFTLKSLDPRAIGSGSSQRVDRYLMIINLGTGCM